MKEKILDGKKKGMPMLLLILALYVVAVAALIWAAIREEAAESAWFGGPDPLAITVMVVCFAWLALGWIFLCGLKVLKPQEALVLTLFGKYIGTLKGEGFYYVNPFCSGVNPAAQTKLNQSGDVDGGKAEKKAEAQAGGKKISLKIMTLNNNRQKINDCLGNPVEIGIAVMWRVVDTAKAVFDVDNYKEYLSLQCDSALRNIVRIYPYDVAPNVDTTGDGVPVLDGLLDHAVQGGQRLIQQRIRGFITMVRARATRCFCPPESWSMRLLRWSRRPSRSMSSSTSSFVETSGLLRRP